MSPAARRYWQAFDAMLRDREAAGGALSEAEEGRHVAALDDLWRELSNEERAEIERALGPD